MTANMPARVWLAAAGLAAFGLAPLARAQAPAPPSGQANRPAADPGRPRLSFAEIPVLLAPHPTGGTFAQDVPPGTKLQVRLWTRPPARLLRIQARQGTLAATRHEIPAAAHKIGRPNDLAPECEPLLAGVQALAAATTVVDADRLERSFESAVQRLPCQALGAMANAVFETSRPLIPATWQLAAGEKLLLDVEALGPDGRATATWKIVLGTEPPAAQWPYATEEEWLAAAVVRDTLGVLWHASRATAPVPVPTVRAVRPTASGTAVVQVDIPLPGGALGQEVALEPNVFAPSAYQALARAIADRLKLRAVRSPASVGLLDRLADLRAANLARESERIGASLTKDPLDASAHEEAALVHVGLALRESAARFSDVRASLARATAHLALSRLSSEPARSPGQVAETALLVLIGRGADAAPRVQKSLADKQAPGPERAWARADFAADDRRLAPGASHRACDADRTPATLSRAPRGAGRAAGARPVPDVTAGARGRLDVDHPGSRRVSAGRQHVCHGVLPGDRRRAAAIVLKKDPKAVAPPEVASAVQPADLAGAVSWKNGRAAVQVLDPETWKAFYARHLVHAANAADEHLRKSLDAPEKADAFAKQVEPYLKDTPWALALEAMKSTREQRGYRPLPCSDFVGWVRRRPDTVPPLVWESLLGTLPGRPHRRDHSHRAPGWDPRSRERPWACRSARRRGPA